MTGPGPTSLPVWEALVAELGDPFEGRHPPTPADEVRPRTGELPAVRPAAAP